MPRSSKSVKAGLAVLLAVVVLAVLWDRAGTTSRLRREFGLDRSEMDSEESIAAGLRRRIPLGSPKARVEEFLKTSVGGDGNADYEYVETPGREAGFHCSVGYEVSEFGFVKESFDLWFGFDSLGLLRNVRVTRQLTGL